MTDNSQKTEVPDGDSLDRAEQMIWMYLDDLLPEQELPELEKLLESDSSAVQLYVDCVKLHTDLIEHFQEPSRKIKLPFSPDTPVLGSLGDGLPGVDAGPPVTDN